MKKIIVDIYEDGKVMIESEGVKGPACTQNTNWLEKALGKVKQRILKKQYHDHELVKIR